jgi:O-antigen/teichoic acid export membrane protein
MLKKPIKNTLWQILGKGGMVLIGIITTGILTRKLGTEAYGSYTLLISIFLLLDSLADFGTKIIGVKEISDEEDLEKKKNIFAQSLWLRLITTAISFLLGLFFILIWKGFNGIKLEAFLSLLMIWFTSIAGSLEIIYQTKMRMDLKIVMDVVFPLFFFIMILVWPGSIALIFVFVGYLIARVLSLIIGIGLIRKESLLVLKKINWKIVKDIFIKSWPMGLYLVVFTSYDRAVDSTIIRNYLSLNEVAWYGLAYKIYSTLLQPAYFFVISIFPLMSSQNKQKKELFLKSFFLLTGGVLFLIAGVYIFAPLIIGILAGSQFAPSVLILRILLIAVFSSYLGHLAGFTLISQGRQKEMLKIGVIVLVFNLAANLFLIPKYGIKAAAIVTGMSETLGFGLMMWELWKIKRD